MREKMHFPSCEFAYVRKSGSFGEGFLPVVKGNGNPLGGEGIPGHEKIGLWTGSRARPVDATGHGRNEDSC